MKLQMPKVLKLTREATSSDNFPVDHYSASSMRLFSTNPILFKVKYINHDRFDTAMNASGVLGTAFHKAMEVYYGGSDTLVVTNESEAIEYGMKAGMELLEAYNDGFINYSKTIENKQKLYDLFTYCFQSYIKEMPYENKGMLAVEDKILEAIDVDWRGQKLTLPVKLKGYLDRVFRGPDEKIRIKDYKTCYAYSNPDKIDGAKILQAVEYYLLAYAKYQEEPYSVIFDEVKYSKNSTKCTDSECKMQHNADRTHKQVQSYEIVFSENELFFDFYFRFYEDMTRALNGEMVYVPNVSTMFDNEVSIIAYIHRLDISEETAKLMKKHKVQNLTELLKKEMQSAGNMRKLLKSVEANFVSAKNLDYDKMNNQDKIKTKLMEHGMLLEFDSIISGCTVDLYRFTPSIGLKMSRIRDYKADVEQVLGISGIRILAPIPSSNLIGFEVPRTERTFPTAPGGKGFKIAIGKDILGDDRYFDIRSAPHLLVAGASGSGKSVFLNVIIPQLAEVGDLHLFDPKIVELAQFKNMAVEYETDAKRINASLLRLTKEMNTRYELMAKTGARSIEGMTGMPYKFVIVDEFGDLILSEAVQINILTLAQKGRAAGIHLIIATQRPSAKIISGDIKANFNTKVVFKTAKAVDSRVVMDEDGAEKLQGKGDMLFVGDHGTERLQGYLA